MTKELEEKSENWVVYLLKCSDGSLYCGITNDLCKRIEKHNSGKGAKYTRGRLPVKLIANTHKMSKSKALQIEHQTKKKRKSHKKSFLEDLRT